MALMERCTWCDRACARWDITPARGDRLCPTCRDAFLEEAVGDWNAAIYGEQFRHARGTDLPVTPRSERYR